MSFFVGGGGGSFTRVQSGFSRGSSCVVLRSTVAGQQNKTSQRFYRGLAAMTVAFAGHPIYIAPDLSG